MAERPILFSGPMVRALLDGRKTQTRRVVKGEPLRWLEDSGFTPGFVADPDSGLCPYGKSGEHLWVREAHYLTDNGYHEFAVFAADKRAVGLHLRDVESLEISYRDIDWSPHRKLRPSIHMPRWASRLTLAVTDVRIERLDECSEADARAEGLQVKDAKWMPFYRGSDDLPWRVESPRDAYKDLWEAINGAGSWSASPWVWVISFRQIEHV